MSSTKTALTLDELKAKVGQEVGVSRWFEVDQKRIDAFADVTEDWQFIHVDPEAAKKTPFGSTIAHGFLSLSLMAPMGYDALPDVAGRAMGVNYGFDKIRFLAPVRAGRRIRGRFTLKELTQKTPKDALMRYEVAVEIEGEDKPALIADWLTMSYFA